MRIRKSLAVVAGCLHVTPAFRWVPQARVRGLPAAATAVAPFIPGGYHATPTGRGRRTRERQHEEAYKPLFIAPVATSEAKSLARTGQRQEQQRHHNRGVPDSNLQSVDFTTALLMSRELKESIVPARIENAYQMDAHNLALQLRTLAGNMWLHVSWHPKGARCHVGGDVPREKEQKAYTFSQTLRSQIRGLNIVAVGLARPMERVVQLDLAPRLDTLPTFRLYFEMMASRSNVILTAVDQAGGAETIAACAYQVYELPPAMTARRRPRLEEPLEDFVEAVGRVPTQQLKKALVAVYQGLSPMLCSVMCSRVPGLTATTRVGDISPEQWSALYSGPWKRWLRIIGDGGCTNAPVGGAAPGGGGGLLSDGGDGALPSQATSLVPTMPWISEDGTSYYPTTLGEEGGGDGHDGVTEGTVAVEGSAGSVGGSNEGQRVRILTTLGKVMEEYYRGTQSNEEFDGLKRRCLARITSTLSKLRERAADFEGQLAAAQEGKVSELNRRGDLLMTYGHAWEYGQTHVECEDFDTGERVSVEIPRDKTPIEEAQEAFKRGKKLKRSAVVVRDLLERVSFWGEVLSLCLDGLRFVDLEQH